MSRKCHALHDLLTSSLDGGICIHVFSTLRSSMVYVSAPKFSDQDSS